MAREILYCFLVDEALKNLLRLDTDNSVDQGYGLLDYELSNYLVKRGVISDNRKTRLNILENTTAYGEMSIWFDQNKFNTTILENLSDIEQSLLLNIIERIYLHQEFTDTNLEYQLNNNGAYNGYVPNSLMHSIEENTVTIYDKDRNPHEIPMYDWYAFDFMINESPITVHFWVSSKAFKTSYPYTTITSVIPPYDPKVLVNPVELLQATTTNVLITGPSYIFNRTNVETIARDQNGVYRYYTKYCMDANKSMQVPFALPYCGAKEPDSLSCRKAIRDYLEEETGLSSNVISQFFPELYIGSRFYLVPLWDLYTDHPDRDIYPSIFSLEKMIEKAMIAYIYQDKDFIDSNTELILNAHDKMMILSLPDELNEDHFSVLKQHPTYQNYSSQVPGWKYMTAATQEFAGKLNRCLAVLHGEVLTEEFIRVEYNDSFYLSFTSGESEYLVMEKDSYFKMIEDL